MKHTGSAWFLSILFAAFILAPSAIGADNEPEIPWDRLRTSASEYLENCVEPKDVAGMAKKFKQRVKQRMEDNETIGEDVIMRSLMLDWAAGNDAKLKRKEKDTVMQACFYFVTFIDKGFLVPQQIRVRLTPDTQKEIFDYLDGEVAKVKETKP